MLQITPFRTKSKYFRRLIDDPTKGTCNPETNDTREIQNYIRSGILE
jgi:hypothetical protein